MIKLDFRFIILDVGDIMHCFNRVDKIKDISLSWIM